MTSPDEIARAVEAGADAVGVIVAQSPRRVPPSSLRALAAAVPPFVSKIGVLAGEQNDDLAQALQEFGFTLQFSGDESAEYCEHVTRGLPYVKAFHLEPGVSTTPSDLRLRAYVHATWMFDSRVGGRNGGTGVAFPWRAIEAIAAVRPVIVSGGLTPENVGACVRAVRPYAVDVRSGIETGCQKDLEKMDAFVRAVREADADRSLESAYLP